MAILLGFVSATDGMPAAAKWSGVQAPHSRGALQKLVIDSKFNTAVEKFKEMTFHFLKVPILYWGYWQRQSAVVKR